MRGKIIAYINLLKNWRKYVSIQKGVQLDTSTLNNYIIKAATKKEKIVYQPPSAMIRNIRIQRTYPVTAYDNVLGQVSGHVLEYRVTPFPIFKEIIRRNPETDKLGPNCRGLNIASTYSRTNEVRRQYSKFLIVRDQLLATLNSPTIIKVRELIRTKELLILNKLAKRNITNAIKNAKIYSIRHKESSYVSGMKWAARSSEEIEACTRAEITFYDQLYQLLETLSSDEMLVWDPEIGFEGIRGRSDLDNENITDDPIFEVFKETITRSRDVHSLGPMSHMWAYLSEEEISDFENGLFKELSVILGCKLYTPYVNNQVIWELLVKDQEFWGADGSNWQTISAIITRTCLTAINIGWPVLGSGGSLTGLWSTVAIFSFVIVKYGPQEILIGFGDDILLRKAVPDFKHVFEKGPKDYFLGYNFTKRMAEGVKIGKNSAKKNRTYYRPWSTITELQYAESIPDVQSRISVAIAYGFCPFLNPVILNANSAEYMKSDELGEFLVESNQKLWDEAVQWFNKEGYLLWGPEIDIKYAEEKENPDDVVEVYWDD